MQHLRQEKINTDIIEKELVPLAKQLGASDAAIIRTKDIVAEEGLAKLCREPRCENYGQSPSCPPHVAGPEGFRKLLSNYETALFLKIDVPTEIILSSQIREIMQLLHEIAATVEQTARDLGFPDPRAFAGGSCKNLFCNDHAGCRILTDGQACRNPDKARPSMSGFGIDVSRLMLAAGWKLEKITRRTDPQEISMGTVSALVLMG